MILLRPLTYLLFVLLITSCSGNSQILVRGAVVDDVEGFPQDSIVVLIDDSTATTNAKGEFRFEDISPGEHTLTLKRSDGSVIFSRPLKVSTSVPHYLSLKVPPVCEYTATTNICPICNKSDAVIPILYGLPSEEMFEASENGEIMLGGCVISDCDPHHYCTRDEKEF